LALDRALDFSERVGLYAVVADAQHEHAAAFYRSPGFVPTLDAPLRLYLPLATLVKTR
jgi:hypothetical protein